MRFNTIATISSFCLIQPSIHIFINMASITFLSRYVLGYKGNARQQCVQSRGPRASSMKVIHVVAASCSPAQLQSLLSDRLLPLCSSEDTEIQVSKTHTHSYNMTIVGCSRGIHLDLSGSALSCTVSLNTSCVCDHPKLCFMFAFSSIKTQYQQWIHVIRATWSFFSQGSTVSAAPSSSQTPSL